MVTSLDEKRILALLEKLDPAPLQTCEDPECRHIEHAATQLAPLAA